MDVVRDLAAGSVLAFPPWLRASVEGAPRGAAASVLAFDVVAAAAAERNGLARAHRVAGAQEVGSVAQVAHLEECPSSGGALLRPELKSTGRPVAEVLRS